MADRNSDKANCTRTCWKAGLAAGVLAAVLLMALGGWSFIGALVGGAVVCGAAGLALGALMCRDTPQTNAVAPAAPKPTTPAATAASPVIAEPAVEPTPEPAPSAVKSGTLLDGQEELASRKGEWSYTAPPTAENPTEANEAPAEAPAPEPEQPASPAPAVKSGTLLAGQEELASRKGVWSYTAPTAQPADSDAKPPALGAARDGNPDDLKRIKGIGPKLEALLNSLGFYHFDQIASWSDQEVAWVDQNIEGFKGRVVRDGWVAQARALGGGS